jgi:hypothetical protein
MHDILGGVHHARQIVCFDIGYACSAQGNKNIAALNYAY